MKLPRRSVALAAFVAAAAASSVAFAGDHQICYQDQTSSTGNMNVIFGCRSDTPGVTCTINTPLSANFVWTPAGYVKKMNVGTLSGSYSATISWSDGTYRSCDVSVLDPSLGQGAPSAGAQLVGYTTDASGFLMTAVWTHRSNVNQERVAQTMSVPWDMVAIGGGVVGAETPAGALVYMSRGTQDLEKRQWMVGTSDLLYPQPHDNDAYIIGLKIQGLDPAAGMGRTQTLRSMISEQQGAFDPNNWLPMPSGTENPASGTVLLSGGVYGWNPWGINQYATNSYPNVVPVFCSPVLGSGCVPHNEAFGWTSTSKDHGIASSGRVTVDLHTINVQFTINGSTFHVAQSVFSATSGLAEHPSIVVNGAPGEYALTGIGAYVDWMSYIPPGTILGTAADPYLLYGRLLWKLEPRPDIAGVEVGSKDHAYVAPATITGYAVGIKLVPGPVPTSPFLPIKVGP